MPKQEIKGMLKRAFFGLMSLLLAWVVCTNTYAEENVSKESEYSSQMAQIAINRMIRGFENFEERIDISELNISPDDIGRLFADATKNSPYLFYVDNHLSYTYRRGGNIVSVIPKYECTRKEAEERIEFCRSEIKKLAALADLGKTEYQKVTLAHDLICRHYKYDLTLESNDLYSFLSSGMGTCQGYTWAYMALLREMGVECEYVASDKLVHIWLKLKIDGEWYHSDATWDDPPSEEGKSGELSRRHFLFSDKKADADGYIERYSGGGQVCNSEKYDAETLSTYHMDGDIDHSLTVDLYDLISLRCYIEFGERHSDICAVCADIGTDMILDASDLDALRLALLDLP